MILHYDSTDKQPGAQALSIIMDEVAGLVDPMDEDGLHAVREVAKGVETYLADTKSVAASNHVRALTTRALICSGRTNMGSRLMLAGGGLVKVTHSALVEEGVVLTLNLRRLAVRHDERLDLVIRRCLLLVIDSMAHMWDQAGGRGMLGLRNLRAAAGGFIGGKAKPGQVNRLARETLSLCRERLELLRHRREWAELPVVCDLDWVTRTSKRQRKESNS